MRAATQPKAMMRLKIAAALLAALFVTACGSTNPWSFPATRFNLTPEPDPELRDITWEEPDGEMGFYLAAWTTSFVFGLAVDIALLPITGSRDLIFHPLFGSDDEDGEG